MHKIKVFGTAKVGKNHLMHEISVSQITKLIQKASDFEKHTFCFLMNKFYILLEVILSVHLINYREKPFLMEKFRDLYFSIND